MAATNRGIRALIGAGLVAAVTLAACGDGSDPPDLRKQAVDACVESDPTLDRASCACLVDRLGLTADEVEQLAELDQRDVPDPNAEIERILGQRRAAVLLSTTADCSSG